MATKFLKIAVRPRMAVETTRNVSKASNRSIGQYLIQRLEDYGIGHVFGMPGEYILSFYEMLEKSPIQVIGTTREDSAGFAADVYARVNGMSALCVNYRTGVLSVCNSVAGAFAEKSPVVVITGFPGASERQKMHRPHHEIAFQSQSQFFKSFTVASTVLIDPMTAFEEIDRVLATCYSRKQPVYIEIPCDMVNMVPSEVREFSNVSIGSDKEALEKAVKESYNRLLKSKRPVVVAGIEINRFGLQEQFLKLVEQSRLPVTVLLSGKSVISENHPQFIGLYDSGAENTELKKFVEQSDCVLFLGTSIHSNFSIYEYDFSLQPWIIATGEQIQLSPYKRNVGSFRKMHHMQLVPIVFDGVLLKDYLERMVAVGPIPSDKAIPEVLKPKKRRTSQVVERAALSTSRVIKLLNDRLDKNTVVIADSGKALMACSEFVFDSDSEFISAASHRSTGFAIPASLGASVARPKSRVLVIVGDDDFLATGQELSTIIRNGFTPIVIVLDNCVLKGEGNLHENDLELESNYWVHSWIKCFSGDCKVYLAMTEGEFEKAILEAWEDPSRTHLLHLILSANDEKASLFNRSADLGVGKTMAITESRVSVPAVETTVYRETFDETKQIEDRDDNGGTDKNVDTRWKTFLQDIGESLKSEYSEQAIEAGEVARETEIDKTEQSLWDLIRKTRVTLKESMFCPLLSLSRRPTRLLHDAIANKQVDCVLNILGKKIKCSLCLLETEHQTTPEKTFRLDLPSHFRHSILSLEIVSYYSRFIPLGTTAGRPKDVDRHIVATFACLSEKGNNSEARFEIDINRVTIPAYTIALRIVGNA